jgi:organic hydroperoxide reductase OsmC/OhrA
MTATFPHQYDCALTWPGHGGAIVTAEARPSIVGGAPPEFGGDSEWWSPEHLLLSSLNLCLLATFQDLLRRHKLAVFAYRSHGAATLDKTPAGLGFTEFRLHVEIEAPDEIAAQVHELLLKAKAYCMVARALGPPVALEVEVNAKTRTNGFVVA